MSNHQNGLTGAWLIDPSEFDALLSEPPISDAELSARRVTYEEMEANGGFYFVEDRVAVIRIVGTLSNREGWRWRTTSSYLKIADAVAHANSDWKVDSLRFEIDSGGGESTGCSEAASAIAASEKPTLAHAIGSCQSGAYWLASAADRVTAVPTAIVGSIGAVMSLWSDKDSGRVTFRSSPGKAADPNSKAGKSQYQQIIDDLAGLFIEGVAQNRGVSVEFVKANYGDGSSMLAARAMDAGLIDEVVTTGASTSQTATMQSITSEDSQMANDNPITVEALAVLKAERDALKVERDALAERIEGMEPKASAEELRAGMDAIRAEMSAFEARATQAESALESARAEVAQSAEDIAIAKLLAGGFVTPAEETEAREAWKAKAAFPTFWARFESRTAPVVPQGEAGHGAPVAVKTPVDDDAASLDAKVVAYCKDNNLNIRNDYKVALAAVRSAP